MREGEWRGPGQINFTLAAADGAPAAIEYQDGKFVRVVEDPR